MDSANKHDVIIMSNYDIVSINLCQEVGNDELADSDCDIFVAVLCDRFLTTSPRTAGRRKQRPAQSEWIRRTVSSLISPTLILVYALCLQSAFCCVLSFS